MNDLINIDAREKIIVGVSGGRDSMALCHMLKQRGYTIEAVTVDHDLRPESRSEAEQVGIWMKAWNITHHILTWNDANKPKTGIMEAARLARYNLLHDFCRQHNCHYLAVAHHADDQIETFLFRLTKGSGLDGLSGMAVDTPYHDIHILRPLLTMTRQEITAYCEQHAIPFVDDPSNDNEKYTRVRFRHFLESEGMDSKRILTTIDRLSRASDALDIIADNTFGALVSSHPDETYSFSKVEWQDYHSEIRVRILQKVIQRVTGDYFGAQLAKIEESLDILASLQNGKSYALGSVLFTAKNGRIKAAKEIR